ncbi:uncharacterized protein MYCFIDRAFT_127687 [Pseudocercospora fijiensis CIRAD86]|uniref:PPPDE domain-containing protein n=1 Tax=Pseudocercospora fijiensis (strain CIRAD86) TaxID=383855 RepID=N1QD21_PSEFD|nr:uncharacterized protein MYCFIDRAFT_127687 [Pseudocercospora fijiensis CIRAD86]EME89623.1 hypothetical protein MYCFIDRAFT_127687 [Pseudocercospora fijiensis CIRAD86]
MSSTSKTPKQNHRSTSASITLPSNSPTHNASAQQTEIIINVYDLLPPGRLSSLLWTLGGSLLHSGICISNREYAYGGHPQRGVTGVYYTRPKYLPPGGRFRCSILAGLSLCTPGEISAKIQTVSESFLGTDYHLLTNNCNHFTNALCEALTGKSAPGWLNRAAAIGVALPCVVPKEWICPPDVETQEGELVGEEEEEDDDDVQDERSGMLNDHRRRRRREGRRTREEGEDVGLLVNRTDSAGRPLPAAERAPVPKTTTMTSK